MGVDSEGQKLKKQNKALLLPGDVGGALPCQQISERERESERAVAVSGKCSQTPERSRAEHTHIHHATRSAHLSHSH